jgi:hypothetical protein
MMLMVLEMELSLVKRNSGFDRSTQSSSLSLFDSFHARLSEALREEEEGEEREDEVEGGESDGDEAEPCQNQCIGVMEVEGGLGSLMVDGEVDGVEIENGGDDAVADVE